VIDLATTVPAVVTEKLGAVSGPQANTTVLAAVGFFKHTKLFPTVPDNELALIVHPAILPPVFAVNVEQEILP
jgi:hypothetical protein